MLMSATSSMRNGLRDFADVEQQAVAAARAAGEPDVGIDGDVVALIRTRWAVRLALRAAGATAGRRPAPGRQASHRLRRARPAAPGAPAAAGAPPAAPARRTASARLDAPRRRRKAVEDARRADDRRLLRRRERHRESLRCGSARSSDRRRRRRSSPAARRPSGRRPSPRRRCRRWPCRADRSRPCACASRGTSARWSRYFTLAMSAMSKMRMPRSRSLLTGSGTPWMPQSTRPRLAFARHEQQVPVDRHVALRRRADIGQHQRRASRASRCRRSGSRCSCPESRTCPVNARSELVTPRNFGSAASSRRAGCSTRPVRHPSGRRASPTRGSGLGAVSRDDRRHRRGHHGRRRRWWRRRRTAHGRRRRHRRPARRQRRPAAAGRGGGAAARPARRLAARAPAAVAGAAAGGARGRCGAARRRRRARAAEGVGFDFDAQRRRAAGRRAAHRRAIS